MENLSDPIFRYADERPDAPALVEGGATLTYGAVAAYVAKATAYLAGLGVAPGDRVAVAMANSVDHMILIFALFRMGAVLVEVPTLMEAAQRAELIRQFGIRLALTGADGGGMPHDVATTRLPFGWRRELDPLDGDRRHEGGAAPAAIILSSGSTGLPKGVVRSHEDLLRHCRSEVTLSMAGIVSPDRPCPILVPLSVSYGGFLGAAMTALILGCSAVMLPKFAVADEFARAVASWGDAVLPATPDICRSLADLGRPGELLLPELRALQSIGQPLFAGDKRRIVERVTPNLYDTYGAVGAGVIAFLRPEEMLTKGATVGRIVAGMAAEIVDAAGMPVPPGTLGQLRVRRSADVAPGGDDAAACGAAADWVYPGEVARIDADGYLEIRGRAADFVVRRGVEIFPAEIEQALMSHPAVRAAAVVGLPLSASDPELVAFVVKSGPVEHDALVRHCHASLGADKLPDRVFYTDALPRLGTGKLDRTRLAALARGQA